MNRKIWTIKILVSIKDLCIPPSSTANVLHKSATSSLENISSRPSPASLFPGRTRPRQRRRRLGRFFDSKDRHLPLVEKSHHITHLNCFSDETGRPDSDRWLKENVHTSGYITCR